MLLSAPRMAARSHGRVSRESRAMVGEGEEGVGWEGGWREEGVTPRHRRKEGMDGGGGAGDDEGSCGGGSAAGEEEERVTREAPDRRSNPGSLVRPSLTIGNPWPRPGGVGSREEGAEARLVGALKDPGRAAAGTDSSTTSCEGSREAAWEIMASQFRGS